MNKRIPFLLCTAFICLYACNTPSIEDSNKSSNNSTSAQDSVENVFATEEELALAIKYDSINSIKKHQQKKNIDVPPQLEAVQLEKEESKNINKGEIPMDDIGVIVTDPVKEITHVEEQMPMYKGGEEAMMKYIENNLRYPSELKSQSISGISQVSFVVEKDGRITDVSISKTSGYDAFDNEALRLIKSMPRFTPGKNLKGEVTRTPCSIPIVFELDD